MLAGIGIHENCIEERPLIILRHFLKLVYQKLGQLIPSILILNSELTQRFRNIVYHIFIPLLNKIPTHGSKMSFIIRFNHLFILIN